ncbi:hypothetical protein LPB72_01405 [Hydrogenophaga crassostreae]|uniref:DUF2782 domain-containing protein n=2 Tax=Hydrogenophaga crassostreae TaxID=1763535 RepID=A0A162Z7R8_9BURK|nr:hypothetical protein LPB072_14410 [Hydrogenophaga crassostreae]OAD44182.1 hypothetical protein LPB72_01405 [Hydrogenophaga crassostreae]
MQDYPIISLHAMSKSNSFLPGARLFALSIALTAACAAQAQTAQTKESATPVPAESPAAKPGERIERITHEDELARVDELRVGGQTRSIEVTPKNGAPAYEIAPAPGGANLSDNPASKGSTGKSRWRILNF